MDAQATTAILDPAAAAAALDAASQMHVKALDMRTRGFSYRAIAKQLNISHGSAYNMVQVELGALDAFKKNKAEEVIELALRRLDRTVVSLVTALSAPDTDARAKAQLASALVKVEDRRAKLLGLDRPMKIAATNPAGDAHAGFINVAILSTDTIERIVLDIEATPAVALLSA